MSAHALAPAPAPASGGGDELAAHARGILGVDRVLVTIAGDEPLGERVVASAGDGAVGRSDARLLVKHEQQLAAEGKLRAEAHSRVPGRRADAGTWWSSPVRDSDRGVAGTLHVLAPAGWAPDPRTRQMLLTFSGRFASAVSPVMPGYFADDALIVLAREMSELALTADSYEDLMGGVTAAIAPLLDATKVGIGLWHGDSHYLQLLPGSFGSDAAMAASSQTRGSDPRSGASRVRMTGKPYYTNDLEVGIPRYAPWLRLMGVHRLMTLPIPIAGRIGGVLHIANKRTPFVDADMEKAAEVVPFVAGAMEQVRHRLETRRNEALATVVTRAGTAVAQGEPLTRFRASVLDEFCSTVGASMLAISFDTGDPPIVVRNGEPADSAAEKAFMAASAGGGTALRTATRRPRAALDVGWSALHAPVMIGGQREATFSLLRVPCEAFSRDEMAAIRRMANITALAWATERFHQERLEAARMRERQRIADDLHDHVAQILFSGQLTVQSILEQLGDNAPLLPAVARARDLLARSQNSIREVINHLSSPIPGGLLPGFSSLAESVKEEFGIRINVSAGPGLAALQDVSPGTAEIALRATREAAINAAKHAAGCEVWIQLRAQRRRLIVAIEDNGPGMPAKRRAEGYGLRAMRRNLYEHGGLLRIGKSARGGTKYLISFPLARGE